MAAPGRRAFGPRRLVLPLVGSIALLVSLVAVAGGATTADVLPDLRMRTPTDFRVQTLRSGRRLLRFTTAIVNGGPGPFEVRASRASTTATSMAVRQRIRRSDGTWRSATTTASARYTGDGHDHWHVQRVASYELFRLDGVAVKSGAKVGFCFFDTRRLAWISTTVLSRRYLESGCGIRRSRSIVMGISRGWSDVYPWDFAYQWIDVSGVSGTYVVRVAADTEDVYDEARETNNCAWARVRIPRRGSTVTVLASGSTCAAGMGLPAPAPTPRPTASPVPSASESPEPSPAGSPSESPSESPSGSPSESPSGSPSGSPTDGA